jgi:hypothetical protein
VTTIEGLVNAGTDVSINTSGGGGVESGIITINSAITNWTGSGSLSFIADANIEIAGNINWTGDADLSFAGDYIEVFNPITWSGKGTLTLDATNQIFIDADITSSSNAIGTWTAMDFKANQVGPATSSFDGVTLAENKTISSINGNIEIRGKGGNDNNYGIHLSNIGAKIESLGTTADAATITLIGEGGSGANNTYGIYFDESVITSSYGNISVTGTGGGDGTGIQNYGVYIYDDALLESVGTDATAATITITGQGGPGTDRNYGINFNGSTINSQYGNIDLNGTTMGTNDNNYGIHFESNAKIESTGTDADAATITLTGEGKGLSFNHGVHITGATVATDQGDITVTGSSLGTVSNNSGLYLTISGKIESTGDGKITITGQGSHGAGGGDDGIILFQNAEIVSKNGDIYITGTGGEGTSLGNAGMSIVFNSTIESTGTDANAAKITLIGTGGNGTTANSGISLRLGSQVNSAYGDIDLKGTGNGSDHNNYGIHISGSTVSSIGVGNNAASISMNGIAVNGMDQCYGIIIEGSPLGISTIDGDISLTGKSDGSGILNHGIYLNDSTISSTDFASIHLDGTGGFGDRYNDGINFTNSVNLTSKDGNVLLSGVARSSAVSDNCGIKLYDNITVQSTGLATIDMQGEGGSGLDYEDGIYMGTSIAITSIDGDISLTGTSNGTREGSCGVFGKDGVEVSSNNGSISIIGHSNSGTLDGNCGIWLKSDAKIQTAGIGKIFMWGTASPQSTIDTYGVYIENSAPNSQILGGTSSAYDAVVIKGLGSLASSEGIYIDSVHVVQSAGGGNIILAGDNPNYNKNCFDTSGALNLQPYLDSTSIGIGSGTSGDFTFDYPEKFTGLNVGSTIIGSYTGSHAIETTSFTDPAKPLTFRGNSVAVLNAINSPSTIDFYIGQTADGTFSLHDNISASSVMVTGGNNVTNTFIKNLPADHTWYITSDNTGYLLNIDFNNIQNLIGGVGADVFVFSDGARLIGSGFIDGVWPAFINALDYTNFTSPVIIIKTGPYSGLASNLGDGYDNIGILIGNIFYGGPVVTTNTFIALTQHLEDVIRRFNFFHFERIISHYLYINSPLLWGKGKVQPWNYEFFVLPQLNKYLYHFPKIKS